MRQHQVETVAQAEEERQRLTGAFATLSAEALAKNNAQFLTLADTRFGEARTVAQGDLDAAPQAIEQLLTPLSEPLCRYEQGIRLLESERQAPTPG